MIKKRSSVQLILITAVFTTILSVDISVSKTLHSGYTTKLQTALKGVNTEIKDTRSQLRDVDKLLKLDPGNTELPAQKGN